MDDKEQKRIFSTNLKYQLSLHKMSQTDLANYLKVTKACVNNWCLGISIPTAGKIQTIADYFKIGKSQLLDDQSEGNRSLYLSDLEEELIFAFRQADTFDKTTVLRTLHIESKKSDSELSNNVG